MNSREQLAVLRAELEYAELAAEYEELVEKYRETGEGKAAYREAAEKLNALRAKIRSGERRPIVAAGPPAPVEQPKKKRWWA